MVKSDGLAAKHVLKHGDVAFNNGLKLLDKYSKFGFRYGEWNDFCMKMGGIFKLMAISTRSLMIHHVILGNPVFAKPDDGYHRLPRDATDHQWWAEVAMALFPSKMTNEFTVDGAFQSRLAGKSPN